MKNHHNNPYKRQPKDSDFIAHLQAVFHYLSEFWL